MDALERAALDLARRAAGLASSLRGAGAGWHADNLAEKAKGVGLRVSEAKGVSAPRMRLAALEEAVKACGEVLHWLRVCEDMDPVGVAEVRPYALRAEKAVLARMHRIEGQIGKRRS